MQPPPRLAARAAQASIWSIEAAGSPEAAGMMWAVRWKSAATWTGVSFGSRSSSRATTPETCAAANEEPEKKS